MPWQICNPQQHSVLYIINWVAQENIFTGTSDTKDITTRTYTHLAFIKFVLGRQNYFRALLVRHEVAIT